MIRFRLLNGEAVKENVFYLAHPLETYGNLEENYQKEDKIANFLFEKLKYPSITLRRPLVELKNYFDDLTEKGIETEVIRELILKRCEEMIKSVSEKGGALLLTGNWRKSEGCLREYKYALSLGMPILELQDQKKLP